MRAQASASPAAARIRFVGRVPHHEVERYYGLVDVLAYPRKRMRLTDLVTPYLGTQLILDALPQIGPPDRLKLLVLQGGHMFYSIDASRSALRDAARAAIVGKE